MTKKLEEKQHALNVSEQGRADTTAALKKANGTIDAANDTIKTLCTAGKALEEQAVIAGRRNTAATTFEVFKGVLLLLLVVAGFLCCWQGWLPSLLWAGLLIWSYCSSITTKRTKTLENIWFLLFYLLSLFLLLVAVGTLPVSISVVRALFGLFGQGTPFVGHVCAVAGVVICQIASIFWHRFGIMDTKENDTEREKKRDSRIKSAFKAFTGIGEFGTVSVPASPLRKEYDKPVFSDSEREERSRGREYYLIVSGSEALPDQCKGAKIVCDTREDDKENPIVVYEADSLSMLELMRDWNKKPQTPEKGPKKYKGPDGPYNGR